MTKPDSKNHMTASKQTPMMAQYLSIKEKYRDSILFYRMGDFYEMFFEDAEVASKILDIALTSRNKNADTPIPMCGFPIKAVEGYIARLLHHGKKVTICEQVEDPKTAKGLVKRDVVRVITPGMILDDTFLEDKSHNFILSITLYEEMIGMAYLDISTGTFKLAESGDAAQVIEEALRIAPSELIFAESIQSAPLYPAFKDAFPETSFSFMEDIPEKFSTCRALLVDTFNTRSLEGFGCEHMKAAVCAASTILIYVKDTQRQENLYVSQIETYSLSDYLQIDDISCRNLELIKNLRTGTLKGTLLGVIDKTLTAMGGRRMKNWIRYPLLAETKITERLDAIEEACQKGGLRKSIRNNLKNIFDLERLGGKITMGQSNARDLLALKSSILALPTILNDLTGFSAPLFRFPIDIAVLLDLGQLIERAIREDALPTLKEGGIIKTGFNEQLDELIQMSTEGKKWLAKLEAEEKQKTGIATLKVKYNKVFGYFIEISKAAAKSVPDHYIRKQTLVNAERFITEDLKNFELKVLNAEEKRGALEYEIFCYIRKNTIAKNQEIMAVAAFLSQMDCLLGLAEIADLNHYCRPEINHEGVIQVTDGRHPVVEKMIEGERFVPNSIRMDNETQQVLVITGPNMAGKSTVLRQVALHLILAQMGAFVPAKTASLCIADRIFTRVGALDNLSQGQSTFMVEMEETANILNNATPRSIVIMDEIGRGTSTFDGLSIAWAVAEYLHDLDQKGVKTLFATHYHELTELALIKSRVKNFNIAVKEWNEKIIFLRKLVEGGTNRSYGIQVARLAGVPRAVIKRSQKVLDLIDNEFKCWGNHAAGSPLTAGLVHKPKREIQLELFPPPVPETDGQWIIEKLKELNISAMTPLEALNVLNEFKEEAAKGETV